MPSLIRPTTGSEIPTHSFALPAETLHLADVLLHVAEHLSAHDLVNLAAVDRRVRTIIDHHTALWGGPALQQNNALQAPSARQSWVVAWSERAHRSPPELQIALHRKAGNASHESLPDVLSPVYLGVELLVCRARRSIRNGVSRGTGYPFAEANAACHAAASIGLDLADDLRKFEARLQIANCLRYATRDAEEGSPDAMEINLEEAVHFAAQADLPVPSLLEDLRMDAYARGMARYQQNILHLARDFSVSGVVDQSERVASYAQKAGMPVPNPSPDALREACLEGMQKGMSDLLDAANTGNIQLFRLYVRDLATLAAIAGIPAPRPSEALVHRAYTNGRNVAMEQANRYARSADFELMEGMIAESNGFAEHVGAPKLVMDPDLKRSAYRNSVPKILQYVSRWAQEGDVFNVVHYLDKAAHCIQSAGDTLTPDIFKSARKTLLAHGHAGEEQIRAAYDRHRRAAQGR